MHDNGYEAGYLYSLEQGLPLVEIACRVKTDLMPRANQPSLYGVIMCSG